MAETYDVAIAPHCPLGPIALAACMQVDLTTPNFVIQEMLKPFNNSQLSPEQCRLQGCRIKVSTDAMRDKVIGKRSIGWNHGTRPSGIEEGPNGLECHNSLDSITRISEGQDCGAQQFGAYPRQLSVSTSTSFV